MPRIDTSALAHPKPAPRKKRERADDDREHKANLQKLPCLAGPVGCQGDVVVHYLRRTGRPESRGMGMRSAHRWGVSLCDGHHTRNKDAVHRTGDEVRWFSERGIDQIAAAEALWRNRGNLAAMRRVISRAQP